MLRTVPSSSVIGWWCVGREAPVGQIGRHEPDPLGRFLPFIETGQCQAVPGGQRSGDGLPTRGGHVIEVVSCVPDGDRLHHLGGSNRLPAETARSV